ncbi:MAG: hypothetical protein U9R27_01185 [Campylobacterota bacterium]|nr:hypothetical protein [Campylobacterota bacterium]
MYSHRPQHIEILDMMPYKLILVLTLLISFFVKSVAADCYFIRLDGYHLTQGADVFSWGELSPLIGLEAGYYFHLSPRGQHIIDISRGREGNLQGELYYIPQNLIDKDNNFSLRIMVLDRDNDTADDLVLPLNERSISLAPASFVLDRLRVDAYFQQFGDYTTTRPRNEQSYQFEILREPGDCSLDTARGRANDHRFRLENHLKRLHLHIKAYEEDFISGGQEYQSYRVPDIRGYSLADALDITEIIAAVNSSELISLGVELEKLRDVKNFPNVWREYKRLVRRLLRQKITIQYREEKIDKKMEVPSLDFHPDWEKLTGNAAILPPESWKIKTR